MKYVDNTGTFLIQKNKNLNIRLKEKTEVQQAPL